MKLELHRGDITREPVDAIVNAANSSLFGGGGVDGAIHRAGGPDILAECRRLRVTTHRSGLAVGDAVATTAGRLPARWVIHTVGPIYGRGTQEHLRSCYRTSLAVARELGARTVAFPLISAGVYRWPVDEAIAIARDEIAAAPNDGTATLVLFTPAVFRHAQKIIRP
jgi:O-acetyl-ADP-ribose deacetylase (regulator of RNase III)